MPYFENKAARLYYEERGQGQPLLFLHGFGWDMRQWQRQIAHFAPQYRVIALDARGHGKSSLPAGPVDPALFWQDAVALLAHLDIPKAIICGSSMGGHVALQAAIHAPARVQGLILVGAICTNQFNRYERVAVPINRFCQRVMPMTWIAWSIAAAMGKSGPQAKQYIHEVVGTTDHDVYNRTWKAVTSMESRAGLAKITCPTLLLVGDRDSMTGRQQPYMHAQIKGSQLVTIEKAGHATNFDNPEQVEQEIAAFLRGK